MKLKMGSGASNPVNSVSALEVTQEKRRDTNSHVEETSVTKDNVSVKKSSSYSQRLSPSQDPIVKFKSQKELKKKTETETEVVSLPSTGNTVKSSESQTKVTTLKNLSNEELRARIRQLEKELAHCESQKLDLQDQVQALEERSKENPESILSDTAERNLSLNGTVHAKDQYIIKLEKDLLNVQAESNKMRVKLKKRIRALNNQLHEVRQEASIAQLEMNLGSRERDKSVSKGIGGKSITGLGGASDSSQSKVIVELSNQMSEQSQQITALESEVAQKDLRILELEKLLNDKLNPQSSSALSSNKFHKMETLHSDELPPSSDRLHSSRGKRYFTKTSDHDSHSPLPDQQDECSLSGQGRSSKLSSKSHQSKPAFERQSTALSDSDTDWDIDSVPSHTHSAPARTRIKSAMLNSGTKNGVGNERANTHGEDDSIMDLANFRAENNSSSLHQRVRPQKRSALRNRLEQQKKHNELNALMGPSLAFAAPNKELPSDTSCEPTPRNSDPSKLPGFSKLKVVHPAAL